MFSGICRKLMEGKTKRLRGFWRQSNGRAREVYLFAIEGAKRLKLCKKMLLQWDPFPVVTDKKIVRA